MESTLGCNLECIMCGSHLSGVTKLRRSMSTELLERVEKEVMPTIEEFSLTVAGEPFLTPKLPQFVAVAERAGAELSINTNATLIKDTNLLRRTMANSRVVRFSVDGASKATYESIRVQSDFDLVMANIELVVRVRNELPREKRPRLVMCMVLMQRNLHELEIMVELAHGLGMDRLDVAHLTVLVPEMDGESLRHNPAEADAGLRAAQARADELGFRVNLPPMMSGIRLRPSLTASTRLAATEVRRVTRKQLVRLGRNVRRKMSMLEWSRKAGGRVPCHFLQDGVFITIQGEVAPCPMPGRPIAGNLNESSFDAIWNGPILTAMRMGFIEGSPFECCSHCSQNPEGYEPGDPNTVAPKAYDLPGLADRSVANAK
jgi:MoaA/NifB/PqqE/SkfB family radical SAM enzyme